MKERDQGNDMGKGKERWMAKEKRITKKVFPQKNTNTSSARRSPTTTSSGLTTRILPTPTGVRPPAPPLLTPIPAPARATLAAANANAFGSTHDDGDGVAGPAESVESAGDGGVAQPPRGANVRAVGSSRRWSGCACAGEGVNGGAAGFSFFVLVGVGAEDPSVLVPSAAALIRRCFAVKVILGQVHAGGPHYTTASAT
jgi:hypothetical protein